jgi:hypothetical protein
MVGLEFLKTVTKRPDAVIDQAVRATIAAATSLWGEPFEGEYPESGLGIRRLAPIEFIATTGSAGMGDNMSGWAWTYSQATASTIETWIDVTTSDSVFVVITGIFSLDAIPNQKYLKPTIDGKEYPPIQLGELYALDVARVYFSKPIVVRPEKKILVNMMGGAAKTGSLGFLGWAIGKRSYVIGA